MRALIVRVLRLVLFCSIASRLAFAQSILPTDIAVSMTASQTANLVVGEPIDFFVSVTNNGPEPASGFALISTDLRNEFNISTSQALNCTLGVVIAEPPDQYYNYWWIPTLSQPPMAVGETRECHLRLALFDLAPDEFTFGFGLAYFLEDLDASNNNASVVLRRGQVVPATVPTLSFVMQLVLIGGVAAVAGLALRRARQGSKAIESRIRRI